jgi:L-rhamnose mutarotase
MRLEVAMEDPKTIKLQITFEAFKEAIASLELEEKRRLWQLLNEDISQVEATQFSQHQIQKNNDTFDKPTGEILTIAEIRDRYPCEWVLIAEPESDEQWNALRGKILAHSPDREEINKALIAFKHIQSISIEYTGPLPFDYAVIS